jgi:hypothetical protein
MRVSALSTGASTAGVDDVVSGGLIDVDVVVEDIILEGVRGLTLVLLSSSSSSSSSSDTMSPTNDCAVTLATASSLIILLAYALRDLT